MNDNRSLCSPSRRRHPWTDERYCLYTAGLNFNHKALFTLIFFLLLLVPIFGTAYAEEKESLQAASIYTSVQTPPGFWENLTAFFCNLILPNIMGAMVLFIMSSLFSGINFYSAIQMKRHAFRVMARYLVPWIFFNYLFALLVLFLILPENMSLSQVNKTFFVYCLVATAMPEIAANIKLQLGNSSNAIDLYKYKSRVSDLITERLDVSVTEQQSKELMALAFFYYENLDQFLTKLTIFCNQDNLTDEDINNVNALREKIKRHPVDGKAARVMELEREHHSIVPKLIEFFREDIHRFLASPVADLMDKLSPLLSIAEARKLVEMGVTNPGCFLWRCRFNGMRKRLSEKTGIDETRLSSLYFSTRATQRKRSLFLLKCIIIVAAVVITATGFIYRIQIRRPSFIPGQNNTNQIITKTLPAAGTLQPEITSPSSKPADPSAQDK